MEHLKLIEILSVLGLLVTGAIGYLDHVVNGLDSEIAEDQTSIVSEQINISQKLSDSIQQSIVILANYYSIQSSKDNLNKIENEAKLNKKIEGYEKDSIELQDFLNQKKKNIKDKKDAIKDNKNKMLSEKEKIKILYIILLTLLIISIYLNYIQQNEFKILSEKMDDIKNLIKEKKANCEKSEECNLIELNIVAEIEISLWK